MNTLPDDSKFQKVGDDIREFTRAAAEDQAEATRAMEAATLEADKLANALGGAAEKWQETVEHAGAASEALGASADAIARTGAAAGAANPALREYEALMRSLGGAAPSPARLAVTPPLQGFSRGGPTGGSDPARVAGLVHEKEYVFDAPAVERIGVANLDAIRRGAMPGYAAGGAVGASPVRASAAAAVNLFAPGAATALAGEFSRLSGEIARSRGEMNKLEGAAFNLFRQLLEMALNAMIQRFFGMLGGGLGAGYFPPAPAPSVGFHTLHAGGIVGRDSSGIRFAPPEVFVGAPRLHRGGELRPGERPIIAMDGEEVGWPDQLAAKYGRGGVQAVRIEMIDQNNTRVQVGEPREGADGELVLPMVLAEIEDRVASSVHSGRVGRAIQHTFGLSRRTR